MPKFSYQAITDSGATARGEIDAETPEAASSLLAARGYIPTEVREARGRSQSGSGAGFSLFSGVGTPELILFTKQFKTLIRSGVPMLTILQVLEDQTENKRLRPVLGRIHQDIREGASLHDAFRRHPGIFSPLYCSMLKAGESAGALPDILDRLVYVIEHEHKVKSDVKSAMTYPVIVLAFLGIAFFILLIGVVPKFVNVFKNAGLQLPWPTQICLALYQVISDCRNPPCRALRASSPSCRRAASTFWTPWTSSRARSATTPYRASCRASRTGCGKAAASPDRCAKPRISLPCWST
jgi:type IV pilus assembly protein PilC